MDAICLNGYLYVMGGWSMTGNSDETKWLDTVWRMSLDKKDAWEKMASTPFLRRAIALAAHQKKIYVIGGMKESGEPTTNVDCFDPATNSWTSIAPISGVPLTGFGAAAAEVDGKLIVSTVDGAIQQLEDSTQTWRIVGQVETGRFFHRIVPTTHNEFAIIGGANMSVGKFKETEFVRLSQ
jgi:N-acetylneuraminic acid mutarotase